MRNNLYNFLSVLVALSMVFQMTARTSTGQTAQPSVQDSSSQLVAETLSTLAQYLEVDPQAKLYAESLNRQITNSIDTPNDEVFLLDDPQLELPVNYAGVKRPENALEKNYANQDPLALQRQLARLEQASSYNPPHTWVLTWLKTTWTSIVAFFAVRQPLSVAANPAASTAANGWVQASETGPNRVYLPMIASSGELNDESKVLKTSLFNQLSFDSGNVEIYAQAKTVSEDTLISFNNHPVAQLTNHPHMLAHFSFNIAPKDNGSVASSQFQKTLSIATRYQDTVGVAEDRLTLYFYDEMQKVWVPLPTQVDTKINIAIAQTNHFTTFALMDQLTCQDPSLWYGLAGQPQSVLAAFQTACDRVGLNVLGDRVPQNISTPAIAVPFSSGKLVYNSSDQSVYYLTNPVYDLFVSNNSWIGLPKTDTRLTGPSILYQDEQHNFLGGPFNRFANGFIGFEANASQYEAHQFFPYALRISQNKGAFSLNADRIESGSASITVHFKDGTTWTDVQPWNGTSGVTWQYPNSLPENTPFTFSFDIQRSGTDDLIGYAPCLSFLKDTTYTGNTSGSFSADVKCGGGGSDDDPGIPIDVTPPTIQLEEVWPDGSGNLIVKAVISDDSGAVASASIQGGPGVLSTPLQPAPEYGNNIFTAIFSNIPRSAVLNFTITASDSAGNAATAGGSGRSPYQVDFGRNCAMGPCRGYVPGIGNPLMGGNRVEQIPVTILPGPGDSDISLTLTYNGQDSTVGLVGQGVSFPYQMSLAFYNSPLLIGVQVLYPDGRRIAFIKSGDVYQPIRPNIHDRLEKRGDRYVLITKFLQEFVFDANGRLVEIRDVNGNPIHLSYSGDHLTRIENVSGRGLDFNYNDAGFISAIDGPEGKHYELGYTGTRLTSFKDGRGKVWQYEYEERPVGTLLDAQGKEYNAVDYLLTVVRLPSGEEKHRASYDDQGRVKEQWIGGSEHRTFVYNDDAYTTTVTDAYGKNTLYASDEYGRTVRIDYPDGTSESFGYDDNFNRTYYQDQNGQEWRWTFDDQGNELTEDGPLGLHREWSYNDLSKPTRSTERIDATHTREYTFKYDERGNLTKSCDPYGCSTITYDSHGLPTDLWDAEDQHTIMAYNDKGDPITTTNAANETTKYGYDSAGRQIYLQTPLGPAYTYAYDGGDLLLSVDGPLSSRLSYGYNDNGRLVSSVDAEQHETRYTVDAQGNVTRMEKPLDAPQTAVESYTYGEMGELTGYTDAEGRAWTYQYDARQRLTDTFGPLDTHTHLTLDGVGNVTDATDPEGHTTHTVYDELYRAVTVIANYRPGGTGDDTNITTRYGYDLVSDVLKETDPENNATIYEYDLLGRVILKRDAENQAWTYAYNRIGQLMSVTNPLQHATSYTYDGAGRLASITDALNQATQLEYDRNGNLENQIDPLGVVTHSVYDELNRRTAEIRNYQPGQAQDEQTNVTTIFEYDRNGNLRFTTNPDNFREEIRYDDANRPVEKIDFAGGHSTYTYDKVGNLLTITDDNQHTITLAYNALNQNTVITNPEGHALQFTYNQVGILTALKDARLFDTQYTLDGMYRVIRKVDANQGEWSYRYNRVGKALAETDANQNSKIYTYDKIYRLRTATDAEGNQTAYVWDANSNLKELIDASQHHTTYTYDELDRPTALTNPANETTGYRYDAMGNQTRLIEADNTVTRYGYNPLYRLVSVTENYQADGSQNNDTNVVTAYRYTAGGNLCQMINANGQPTTFEYDGMGRVVREVDAKNNAWNYTFDGVGNLKTRLDANQALTSYSYYPDDSLERIAYPDGASVSFSYDPNNNPIAMRDSLGETTWSYDPLNRVTLVKDAFSRVLQNDYDAVGNRIGMIYPDGGQVQYSYLKNNWLQSLTDPANHLTQYTRDGVGNITRIDYPNTVVATIAYDAANRVTHLDHQQTGGAQKTIAAFDFTYNAVGHVTQTNSQYAWRKPSEISEQYNYDGLHRLSGMTDSEGVVMNYTYDKVGNRLSWTTNDDLSSNTPRDGFSVNFTYNELNQLVQSVMDSDSPNGDVTTTYTYDANGNRMNKAWNSPQAEGVDYAYDFENRLVSALDYQQQANKRVDRALTTLAYNGQGQRLAQSYDAKAGSGGQERVEYVFDRLDPVAEYNMRNDQHDDFYRGGMGRIETMQRFPGETDGQMYWYHYNAKGDVVGLTKQSGQSSHNYRYDPYGAVLPDQGNFTDPHNHYLLTGKAYDENTGLVYFGARHYDLATATWMTQDAYRGAVRAPVTQHRYGYSNHNPINYVDPTGQFACGDGYDDARCEQFDPPAASEQSTQEESSDDDASAAADTDNFMDWDGFAYYPEVNQPTASIGADPKLVQPSWNTQTYNPNDPFSCPYKACMNPAPTKWDLDPLNPDYYSVSINFGLFTPLTGGAIVITRDRYGSYYVAGGGTVGKTLTMASVSAVKGYVGSSSDLYMPNPSDMDSFLTGLSVNGSAGFVIGGGVTWSPLANERVDHVAIEQSGIGGFPPSGLGNFPNVGGKVGFTPTIGVSVQWGVKISP